LLVVMGFWFVFSYLVLWFIGGACLNPLDGSACLASGSLSFLRNVPLIGSLIPFGQWTSLMYFFAPIAGFALALALILWWNSYFETKEASSIIFLVVLLVGLFLGYYLNLFFYYNESAVLNSRGGAVYSLYFCLGEMTDESCYGTVQKLNTEFITQAQKAGAQSVKQLIPVNYWAELRESMYLLFVLGAINAWILLFAKQFLENAWQE